MQECMKQREDILDEHGKQEVRAALAMMQRSLEDVEKVAAGGENGESWKAEVPDDDWEALLLAGQAFIKKWSPQDVTQHQKNVRHILSNYEAIAMNKVPKEDVAQQQSKANELLVHSMYTMNEGELLTGVPEGGTEDGKAMQQCITDMATSDIPGNTVHPALWKRVASILGTAPAAS